MNGDKLEQILKSHLRGVHDEVAALFGGFEKALDLHLVNLELNLAKTEKLISEAIQDQQQENEKRIAALELRVQSLGNRA